jgi:aspartyl-tRNA(Asn)/glutamyl-tRNA(Gln) amidotransferase subunit B
MEYEYIICFETHVELNTETKLFCGCRVSYDSPPNTRICPVCTGQPGALPVLNKKAVQYAIKAGLALNCSINTISRFARKNYFYPDLPKGYQISQYERPFCENGYLDIPGDDGKPYRVGIRRIHLEEDAGKLMHSSDADEDEDYSLVDYNRSCVPLLEIVTDHEQNPMHSLQEARSYLEKLRQTLKYIEISECMLEKGQFRCDVNISIRPRGSLEFGNRTEIKNMSSFRFIMEALEYEIKRQKEIIESGGTINQETRLFDETKKITLPMRSKEDAPDYRYFPDPDLMEVNIDQDFINELEKAMPELPDQQLDRIIEKYGVPKNDAMILTKDKTVSEYFTACAIICEDKRRLGNWIIKELFKLLNDASVTMQECPVKPKDFARLIELVSRSEITEAVGRTVLSEMFSKGMDPDSIIDEKGLRSIKDDDELKKAVDETINENPEAVSQIKAGDTKPVDFLLGKVMRKTRGKADPKKIRELIGQAVSGI